MRGALQAVFILVAVVLAVEAVKRATVTPATYAKTDTDKYIMKPEQQGMQPALAEAVGSGISGKLATPGKPGGSNDLMQKIA